MLHAVFYGALRAWSGWVLRLFYRIEVEAPEPVVEGAAIYVCNHPNALVDPGLVLATVRRRLTFLAKAPLFRIPVMGWVLRRIGALPVHRAQDEPAQPRSNRGLLEAASTALVDGRALMLFPEGRSHSEPALGALKSGAARMALGAAARGAPVWIVPVGLTYAEKHRFRSAVRVAFGAPLRVAAGAADDPAAARALTAEIAAALGRVTVNLARWEELPLLDTAERLYALRQGTSPADPERLRAFARGVEVLRQNRPEELEALRARLAAFHRRLQLLGARPEDLTTHYSPAVVARFALRNLLALVAGLPLFALGMVVFFVPYWVPSLVAKASRADWDMEGTVKLLTAIAVAPLWGLGIAWAVASWAGWGLGVAALLAAVPLALFTRYFFERRAEAWRDARAFFALVRRRRLGALLRAEANELAARIEAQAEQVRGALGAGA